MEGWLSVNILRTHKLTDLPHLNLYRTHYEDRNGDPKDWVFASRQAPPRLMSGQWETPDAVVIVPYHVSRHKLVIIEEFRVVLGGYQYGFPAGLMDAGETVVETCRRELFEETGLSVHRILRQSPPVYSSSGITDEAVSMVFVECDGTPSNAANEIFGALRHNICNMLLTPSISCVSAFHIMAKSISGANRYMLSCPVVAVISRKSLNNFFTFLAVT